ncbi:MAG: hypothetical protein Q8R55_01800 [Candidatus Taylorbacteria bacterium]|nr:hypothetical protein [Candidatus Taylorbacteria bacterium]
MTNPRKIIISSLFLIAISGVVIFLVSKNQASKFEGNLVKVNDSSIIAKGIYLTGTDLKKEQIEVEIAVNESTKIIKSTFDFPRDGSMVIMDKLPKQDSIVDLSVLREDKNRSAVSLLIQLKWGIFGKPVAKEIKYLVPKP